MSTELDENDMQSLKALLGPRAAKSSKSTTPAPKRGALQQRRSAEQRATKKHMAANDGRLKRSTGRNVQFGTQITDETKAMIDQLRTRENMTVASIIEASIAMYYSTITQGGH